MFYVSLVTDGLDGTPAPQATEPQTLTVHGSTVVPESMMFIRVRSTYAQSPQSLPSDAFVAFLNLVNPHKDTISFLPEGAVDTFCTPNEFASTWLILFYGPDPPALEKLPRGSLIIKVPYVKVDLGQFSPATIEAIRGLWSGRVAPPDPHVCPVTPAMTDARAHLKTIAGLCAENEKRCDAELDKYALKNPPRGWVCVPGVG